MLHPKLVDGLLTSLEDFTPGSVVPLAFLFMEYGDEKAKQAYDDLLLNHPVAKQMLEERYLGPDADMEYLASLAEGTLGWTYYRYLTDNNLNPDLLRKSRFIDVHQERGEDIGFITERLFQLHDLSHVLTGFDTTPIGEVKVVSFGVAQTPVPYPALIIGSRPLQAALYKPERFIPLMDAVTEGWQRGRKAKTIMNVHWEEMWAESLQELRQEYNLI